MVTNNSIMIVVGGLTAFSLAIVVVGVSRYRRRRSVGATSGSYDDMRVEADIGNEEQRLRAELLDERDAFKKTSSDTSQGKLPLKFFLLVFVLSAPFWLFGGNKLPLPMNLPVSALVGFTPLIAASILQFRQHGLNGIKALFNKVLDYKRIGNKIWYLPTLFLMPLIYFLSYAVMRLVGLPLPDPKIPYLIVPAYFLMYFIEAVGEELGWMGYANDPMQNRWGALKASLIFGVVYAIWHSFSFIQTQNTPNWVVWQTLSMIPLRILIVWIYNNTGKSVFAAILVHAMYNISWSLFPNNGSHFDPFVTGIFGWGAKTLAQYRYGSVSGTEGCGIHASRPL
jgi:membrane protease YdiL (CAAX protease family)